MRIRILGYNVGAQLLWLVAADAVVALASYAGFARFGDESATYAQSFGHARFWVHCGAFTAFILIASTALGLYAARQRSGPTGIGVRLAGAVGSVVGMVSFLSSLAPGAFLRAGLVLQAGLVVFAGMGLVRVLIDQAASMDLFRQRVLVYGGGQRALSVLGLRRRVDRRGFALAGFVDSGEGSIGIPREQIQSVSTSLLDLARELEVDEIVVAVDDRRRAFPIRDLLECRLNGILVTDLVTFLERETGKVRVDVLNPSWIIFADGFRRDPARLVTTRVFDVVASLSVLLIAWPFMLLTALAIKLEDGWRGAVFYRQDRVGLDGRVFRISKFRSMRSDAEKDGAARWAQKSDDRVTRVGAFIRKVRIDELPQLLNVLSGQMSVVGPRPERPEFVETLSESIPYYRERHCVKPGITGWAQLCYPYGSSEHDASEKLQYDLYYVKNHTLFFDVVILFETAETVLFGKGAR